MPGLPPPRDADEVYVSCEGTWAVLAQSLRYRDAVSKAGVLSLPATAKLLFEQVEELLAILGEQEEHWVGGCSP